MSITTLKSKNYPLLEMSCFLNKALVGTTNRHVANLKNKPVSNRSIYQSGNKIPVGKLLERWPRTKVQRVLPREGDKMTEFKSIHLVHRVDLSKERQVMSI